MQIGDVLRVMVWREPTLTGDFAVDREGMVTLPMLGSLRADGVAWLTLRDSLMAGFRRQVKSDAITLTPLRRVYVLGSVLRPGMYMLDPTSDWKAPFHRLVVQDRMAISIIFA